MHRTLFALLLLQAVALAAPVPKEGPDTSKLYITAGGTITRVNPDGTGEEVVCEKGDGHDDSLSPDGKLIAWVKQDHSKDRHFLMLREPGGEAKEELRVSRMASIHWSADGKAIYGTDQHVRPSPKGGLVEEGRKCWRYEVATGKVTELDIPEKYVIWQETPDGKGLLCKHRTGEQEVAQNVIMPKLATVVTPTGKFEPKVLIPEEVNVVPMAAFPDGKRWVVISIEWERRKMGVFTQGEKKPVWWGTEARLSKFAVSPDGKRVAYSNLLPQEQTGGRESEEYELRVADADGKNAKRILTTRKYITHIDWR